jgi:hypothetical protein
MNYRTAFTLSLLAGCLAFSGFPSRADTQTTTTRTFTTNSVAPSTTQIVTTNSGTPLFNLSATSTYQVVDPITGRLIGAYDRGARLESGVVLVDSANGGLVATVDANGNIVELSRAPANPTLIVSIDARRADLNQRIDAALNKGLLTPIQAAQFRAELDRITADEDAARSGGVVSYSRALQLGYGLTTLSDRLVPITQTVTYQPLISPQFVTVEGRMIMVTGIASREQKMSRRIDDEYAAGRMSARQVSMRKQDMEKIAMLDSQYRKNGVLSNSKERKLSEMLDKVQASIDENVATINSKRSKIGLRTD